MRFEELAHMIEVNFITIRNHRIQNGSLALL
jgi:hypothetical protein